MITIVRSKRFEEEYRKFVRRNMPRAESIIRAITLFIENPRHPSLNIEKLKGSAVWTVRISRSNRLFFIWIDETSIMLVDVGIHDKYKQY